MNNFIRIEVQEQFGRWQKYTSVANNPISIKNGLKAALRTQLASKSKKAIAIEEKTGNLIDMQFG
jgi:hypothetical protein